MRQKPTYEDLARDLISEIRNPLVDRGRAETEAAKLWLRQKRRLPPGAVVEYKGQSEWWSDFVHVVEVSPHEGDMENADEISVGVLRHDHIQKAIEDALVNRDQAWTYLGNEWFERQTGIEGLSKRFGSGGKSWHEMDYQERERASARCADESCNSIAVALIKGTIGMEKFIRSLLADYSWEELLDDVVFSTQVAGDRGLEAYEAFEEVTLNGTTFVVFQMPD